jgi:hypothetical protein
VSGAHIEILDWPAIERQLDVSGWARVPGVLAGAECETLAAMYEDAARFRSRVVMARHGFGEGEYRYFAYPLPDVVQALRTGLYRRLAPIANRWRRALGEAGDFPAEHADYLAECHTAGQTRPTPLLLSYGPGDYNRLHQDVYGERLFPLQATIQLCAPGRDFDGGEFVLTEQRPRMQPRAEVIPLAQGDAVIFAVRHRPVRGARGYFRANLRHGVSRIRSGRRRSLGIIFHDAAGLTDVG